LALTPYRADLTNPTFLVYRYIGHAHIILEMAFRTSSSPALAIVDAVDTRKNGEGFLASQLHGENAREGYASLLRRHSKPYVEGEQRSKQNQ